MSHGYMSPNPYDVIYFWKGDDKRILSIVYVRQGLRKYKYKDKHKDKYKGIYKDKYNKSWQTYDVICYMLYVD